MSGSRAKSRTHATGPKYERHRRAGEQVMKRAEKIEARRRRKVKNDAVQDAIEATENPGKRTHADWILANGDKATIDMPYPMTADHFESAIVVLLNMRAQSEARQAAEAPIVLPKKPTIVLPGH